MNRKNMISRDKVFSGWTLLPKGRAADTVTDGCLVLEGGAFRGVYTSGVLDALLQEGISMQTVIGVSAGAMNGLNYQAGQIGRAARINLRYRHDRRYIGPKPLLKDKGVIGFDFVMNELQQEEPFDWERFSDPRRDFYAVISDVNTGLPRYVSKKEDVDILQAVRASATMPYISKSVDIDGTPYLDGGCTDKVPIEWALDHGFEKIIVVRTRPAGFRKGEDSTLQQDMIQKFYRSNPEFARSLAQSNGRYDQQCEQIERLSRRGRILTIAPSQPVDISRLEGDMEKLGALYYMGYHDARRMMPQIKAYLGLEDQKEPEAARTEE